MRKPRHSKTESEPKGTPLRKGAQLVSPMNKKNRDIGLSQSDSWFLFVQSRFSEGSLIAEHLFLIQNTEITEYCWTGNCLYWSFSLVDGLILFPINMTLLQKTIIDYSLAFLPCLSSEGRESSNVINTGSYSNSFANELIQTLRNGIIPTLHKLC